MNHTESSIEVTCSFLTGSRARGCLVQLNATILGHQLFRVERVNSSGTLKEFFLGPLGDYVVSVFDWEEDGSRAEVAVVYHLTEHMADTTTAVTTTSTCEHTCEQCIEH